MIGVPDAVGEGSRQDSKSICKDKRLKIHGNFVLLNEEVFCQLLPKNLSLFQSGGVGLRGQIKYSA